MTEREYKFLQEKIDKKLEHCDGLTGRTREGYKMAMLKVKSMLHRVYMDFNASEPEELPFTHICKSDREIYPSEFALFARVQYNEDGTVTVDRYQKFGAIHCGKVILDKKTFDKYYTKIESGVDAE